MTKDSSPSNKALTHGSLGYEGPEKTLEVAFSSGSGAGLHAVPMATWESVLAMAKCRILSVMHGKNVMAFVLSESSLFVYPWKLYLKTCGTTTLLICLPILFKATSALGMELDWLRFSRKNFTFPSDQIFPHTSFPQEISYCMDTIKGSANLTGLAQVLGDADNWNVLVVSPQRRIETTDCILNVMMYDMAPEVAALFCVLDGEDERRAASRAIKQANISELLPNCSFDAWMFRPCGFSLNALSENDYYATIHVTPEPAFSYASFETNAPGNHDVLLENLARVFRPHRLTVTVFANQGCRCFTLFSLYFVV